MSRRGARGYPLALRKEALRLRDEGINRSEVARRLGISHTAIQRWEKPLSQVRAADRRRQQDVRDRRNNYQDQRFDNGRPLLSCVVCGDPLTSEHLKPENWHRSGERVHPSLIDDHRSYEPDDRKLISRGLS